MSSNAPDAQAKPPPLMDRVSALFAEKKSAVDKVLKPILTKAENTLRLAAGITELLATRDKDKTELRARLTSISENILARASSKAPDEANLKHAVDALEAAVQKIQKVLDEQRQHKAKALEEQSRAEMLASFIRELDGLSIHYLATHAGHVDDRFEGLELRIRDLRISPESSILPLIGKPPMPTIFCGREELVASIVRRLLDKSPCRIPLLGTGGIGKTSVAVAVIGNEAIKRTFGEKIFFVGCEGVTSADGIVNALSLLAGGGSEVKLMDAVLASLKALGKTLLVLDNFETPLDSADSQRVLLLLGRLGELEELSLIVTMRGNTAPDGVAWETLEPLETLSLQAAADIWTGNGLLKDDQLDVLLPRLDGLPLAICLVARQAKLMKLSAAAMLAVYDREKAKVVKTGRPTRLTSLEISIQLSLNSSVMQEDPCALRLFSVLCLLPDGALLESLSELLPSERDSVMSSASALLHVALASVDRGRIKMLTPVREYALSSHPPDRPLLQDLRTHYLALAQKIPNASEYTKGLIEVRTAEFGNMNAVLLHVWDEPPGPGDRQTAERATVSLAEFSRLVYVGDALQLLRRSADVLDRQGDRAGRARCLVHACYTLRSREQHDEAVLVLERAIEAFRSVGDRLGEARCMHLSADLRMLQGRYDGVVPMLEEAKTVFHPLGERLQEVQCMRSLGNAHMLSGDYDKAIPVLEEARLACVSLGYSIGVAECTHSLGNILRKQKRYDEAITILEKAKEAIRSVGRSIGEAHCTQMIAQVRLDQGKYEEAIRAFEEARTVYRSLGSRPGEAECTTGLGGVLSMQGQYGEATELLEEAGTALHAMGRRLEEGECRMYLGVALRKQSKYDEASVAFDAARRLFRLIGHSSTEGQATRALGDVLFEAGKYEEAVVVLGEAQLVFRSIGKPREEAECAQSVGHKLCLQERYEEGIAALEEAKAVFRSIRDEQGVAECAQRLGNAFRMLGKAEEAILALQAAKTAFQRVGDRLGEAECGWALGEVLISQSMLDEAMVALEEAAAVWRSEGNRLGEAQCAHSMGTIFRMCAMFHEAIAAWEEGRTAFRSVGNRRGEARCALSLGDAYRIQELWEEAVAALEEGRTAFQSLDEREGEAQCLHVLGDTLLLQNKYDEARRVLEEARMMFESIGDRLGAAQCMRSLGRIRYARGMCDEGIALIDEAKNVFRSLEVAELEEDCEEILQVMRKERQELLSTVVGKRSDRSR